MDRQRTIQRIKSIIEAHGSFSTSDIEAESSPIYNNMGEDQYMLIERFDVDDVEIVTYVHETEIGSDFYSYDDLSDDLIEEIEFLAECYNDQQTKFFNTIRSENF